MCDFFPLVCCVHMYVYIPEYNFGVWLLVADWVPPGLGSPPPSVSTICMSMWCVVGCGLYIWDVPLLA